MDIKKLRKITELTQGAFAEKYGIPLRTLQNWELGDRTPPNYVLTLLERAVREDFEKKFQPPIDKDTH